MSEKPKPLGHISEYGLEKLNTRRHYCVTISHLPENEYQIPVYPASSLTALEEENARLKGRVAHLERFLFPYANRTDICGISWDGKYLIGDKESIAAFHSLKNRGEQIDVYKRAFDQNLAAAEARAHAAEQRVKDAVEFVREFASTTAREDRADAARAFIKEAGE
jgi:hypothetical protein